MAEGAPGAAAAPTRRQIFSTFALIGLLGFGGVLPWARYMFVEKRRWMDDAGFAELFALGQFFPGPNIGNVGVIYGRRTNGAAGAGLALAGLYLFPTIITIAAGFALERWWRLPQVQQVFGAVMPVASGLMLGTAFRLVKGVPRRLSAFAVLALTFGLMAVVKWPLWLVLLICAPLSLGLAFGARRHAAHA